MSNSDHYFFYIINLPRNIIFPTIFFGIILVNILYCNCEKLLLYILIIPKKIGFRYLFYKDATRYSKIYE